MIQICEKMKKKLEKGIKFDVNLPKNKNQNFFAKTHQKKVEQL